MTYKAPVTPLLSYPFRSFTLMSCPFHDCPLSSFTVMSCQFRNCPVSFLLSCTCQVLYRHVPFRSFTVKSLSGPLPSCPASSVNVLSASYYHVPFSSLFSCTCQLLTSMSMSAPSLVMSCQLRRLHVLSAHYCHALSVP